MTDPTTTRGPAAAAAAALLAGVAALPAQAQEPDYPTEPPSPMEARDVELPELGRDTLDNGLELVVIENREQPVVSVRLYVPGGSAADPEGRTGVASLTSRVLDKGTGERTAEEIASTVEGVGASLNTGASDDYAFVATSALTRHLPTVLEVFSDVVTNATFPDSEVENERRRMQSDLQQELSQPSALAARHFERIVYGDHPYGDAPTPDGVAALERQDLADFHDERYVPEGSLLIFAGDVDLESARETAREWFGDWRGERPPEADRPEPPSRDSAQIHLVHRPGSEQSVIRLGHLAVEPGHEDAYALEVANRVLGGGANARLFLILREEKGWTYGAYSQLSENRDAGVFAAQAEVRNPVTDSSLSELLRQVRRLRDEPVPEEELDEAKAYLTGNFPLQLETPQQVASQVADVLLRGLEADYLETYRSRISEIGADAVQDAARRHLHPDRAAIVVVGDATQVHEDLSGIGPVAVHDTEGEPLEMAELEVRRSDVVFDASRMRTGTFGYRIVFQGDPVGEATVGVEEAGDGRYRVEQDVSAGGGGQTASYVVTRDLSPVSVTQQSRGGPVSLGRDLEYGDGRVTGSATVVSGAPEGGEGGAQQGPPETEDVEVDTAVVEGTIDENMDLAAVLSAPLEEGLEFGVPIFSPSGGVSQLTATVTGRETVEVAAGSYDAWVVELDRAEQPATLWVTDGPPRMLLKVEFTDQPVSQELQSVGDDQGREEGGSGS
ncbi:MAG: insulinase family protein [Gemmatimonadota bacterium]